MARGQQTAAGEVFANYFLGNLWTPKSISVEISEMYFGVEDGGLNSTLG